MEIKSTQKSRCYWLHAVTPVHLGTGRGLDYIDLPVAREAVTRWPYLPGSSVKGVIADYYGATQEARKNANDEQRLLAYAFGCAAEGGEDNGIAGSLVFTDAHILCLPVRSFFGAFAWITSPFCLTRFARDSHKKISKVKLSGQMAVVTESSCLTENGGKKLYLEDIDLNVDLAKSKDAGEIAAMIAQAVFKGDSEWQEIFKNRFAIVDDNTFTFLCEMGTEVNAHISIDPNNGVVRKGALWYEETLPVETIMSGMIWCEKVYAPKKNSPNTTETGIDLTDVLLNTYCRDCELQIGGKASTGKGIVRLVFDEAGRS